MKIHYAPHGEQNRRKKLIRQSSGMLQSDVDHQIENVKGFQTMNVPIFNVIQLMTLVTLCCQGKSDVAESYSKQYILTFQVCGNIIVQAENFWPLKKAVLEYCLHAFMETADQDFLKQSAD